MSWIGWAIIISLIIILIIVIAIITAIIIGIVFIIKYIGYIVGFIVGYVIHTLIQALIASTIGWWTFAIPNIITIVILEVGGAIGSSILKKNWWWLLSTPMGFELFMSNLFAIAFSSIAGGESWDSKARFIVLKPDAAPSIIEADVNKSFKDILANFGLQSARRICFTDTETEPCKNNTIDYSLVSEKTPKDVGWNGSMITIDAT